MHLYFFFDASPVSSSCRQLAGCRLVGRNPAQPGTLSTANMRGILHFSRFRISFFHSSVRLASVPASDVNRCFRARTKLSGSHAWAREDVTAHQAAQDQSILGGKFQNKTLVFSIFVAFSGRSWTLKIPPKIPR